MQCEICSRIFKSARRLYKYNFSFPMYNTVTRNACAECADIMDSYIITAINQCNVLIRKLVSEALDEGKTLNISKPV